VVGKFEL
jgi:hypothetical protein